MKYDRAIFCELEVEDISDKFEVLGIVYERFIQSRPLRKSNDIKVTK